MFKNTAFFFKKRGKYHLIINTESGKRGEINQCWKIPRSFLKKRGENNLIIDIESGERGELASRLNSFVRDCRCSQLKESYVHFR